MAARTYALDKRLAEQEQQKQEAAEPRKMTRAEIARKAARARWNKQKGDHDEG